MQPDSNIDSDPVHSEPLNIEKSPKTMPKSQNRKVLRAKRRSIDKSSPESEPEENFDFPFIFENRLIQSMILPMLSINDLGNLRLSFADFFHILVYFYSINDSFEEYK